jgi:hypothetical protein
MSRNPTPTPAYSPFLLRRPSPAAVFRVLSVPAPASKLLVVLTTILFSTTVASICSAPHLLTAPSSEGAYQAIESSVALTQTLSNFTSLIHRQPTPASSLASAFRFI